MPAFRGRRLAVFALTGGTAATLLAVGAYGYSALRWGCPSNAEIEHPISSASVEEAFAARGLDLRSSRFPVLLPPRAKAYRHEAEDATVFVVVCDELCGGEGPHRVPDITEVVFTSMQGIPQRVRSGIILLNLHIYLTDADRRSAQRLRRKVEASADELDRNPKPDDRCYVR